MTTLRSKFHLVTVGAIEKAQTMKNTQTANIALSFILDLVWNSGTATASNEDFISAIKQSSILLLTLKQNKSEGLAFLTNYINILKENHPEEFKSPAPQPKHDLSDAADQKNSQSNVDSSVPSTSQKNILSSLQNQSAVNKLASNSASGDKIKQQGKVSSESDDFNQNMRNDTTNHDNKTNPSCIELATRFVR